MDKKIDLGLATTATRDALADFGAAVVQEIRDRFQHKEPERDADGFARRSPLDHGLARDGFHKIADSARARGLFDDTPEPEPCSQCHDNILPGFACRTCGYES